MLSWPPNVNTAGSLTTSLQRNPSRRFLTAVLRQLWLCATCDSINALFHSRRCDVLFTLLHVWFLLLCFNINDGWHTGYESPKLELEHSWWNVPKEPESLQHNIVLGECGACMYACKGGGPRIVLTKIKKNVSTFRQESWSLLYDRKWKGFGAPLSNTQAVGLSEQLLTTITGQAATQLYTEKLHPWLMTLNNTSMNLTRLPYRHIERACTK